MTQTITTSRGPVQVGISEASGQPAQINVFLPPAGPPFFLVFPEGSGKAALAAAVLLIERGDLPEATDVTRQVPGALAAGTTRRPHFAAASPSGGGAWCSAEFGVPTVAHAEAA